jgi:hypothetical protein
MENLSNKRGKERETAATEMGVGSGIARAVVFDDLRSNER